MVPPAGAALLLPSEYAAAMELAGTEETEEWGASPTKAVKLAGTEEATGAVASAGPAEEARGKSRT